MLTVSRGAALLATLTLASGCMTTHTDELRVRGAESRRVIAPDERDSVVEGEFSYEAGVAQGSVRWSSRCREALMQSESIEVWHTKTPMYGAAVGALVAGVALGVGSGALLSSAPNYSDQPSSCSVDDSGHESCSSPRDIAIGLGIAGTIVSIIALSAGVGTFATKTERTQGETLPQGERVVSITRRGVACGEGPVAGLGVSVFRADERVSASVTNSAGQVAFAVPPHVSGELTVVVDSVPPPLSRVREGDVVGTFSVPPHAPDAG
jgi:hypothetical protein